MVVRRFAGTEAELICEILMNAPLECWRSFDTDVSPAHRSRCAIVMLGKQEESIHRLHAVQCVQAAL
jgi:hypothetical protein